MHEFSSIALLLGTFGVLLLAAALMGRPAARAGVPVALVFLMLGMLAGSEGLGGIAFENYRTSFQLGTVALILILLDGGLNTSLRTASRTLLPAALLATVGVALTAGLVAGFGHLLGLTWGEALLLGAVVSSTDAATVFSVLRGGGLTLRPTVASTIELESGLNDPMAVILTVTATTWLSGSSITIASAALDIPVQLVVGGAAGLVIGFAARAVLRVVQLSTAGLYPLLTTGAALLAFGAATLLHGSGFLAVFVAALLLGNGPLPFRAGLTRIHDALAWFSQVGMFLMLGLLAFPSQLWHVAPTGLAVALFLAVVARPASVALCLAPLGFGWREIILAGWVGLRGAVPIVLATIPVLAGVSGAMNVFNIVFFIAVVNTLIPGATIRWVTRRLALADEQPPAPQAVLEVSSTRLLRGEVLSFYIREPLAVSGASLADIPFPPESAAVLIVRGDELLAARGHVVLQPGDHVQVFCRPQDRALIELLFGRPEGE